MKAYLKLTPDRSLWLFLGRRRRTPHVGIGSGTEAPRDPSRLGIVRVDFSNFPLRLRLQDRLVFFIRRHSYVQ